MTIKARAHGRVNLIGEHTDYNNGWVLPTLIPQYTEVTLEKNTNNEVILMSSGDRIYSYKLGEETPTGSWVDYLMGGTKLLEGKISGFTARIESNIPEGSGLSSSAALEVSFLKALREMFKLNLSDIDLARMGQEIENEFVGAKVGVMDQMAVCLAKEGEALFLDTMTLEYESVQLPLNEIDLLVINSGISHRLSATDGGYNERRSQCEKAAKLLGVSSLREVSLDKLNNTDIPPLLFKRAKHVITENQRVHEAVDAIKLKDMTKLGELFIKSHSSMRVDYEVSIPEIDYLVGQCLEHPDVYGARLTGGGFGGSIVAITKKGTHDEVAAKVLEAYNRKTSEKGTLLV